VFLPFNKGSDPGGKNCGAGNPVPNGPGYPTDYLWQEVWERESWLEILGRYCIAERNKKKQITRCSSPAITSLWSPGCCRRPCGMKDQGRST
jgi:type I restriction enzyme, R subunit